MLSLLLSLFWRRILRWQVPFCESDIAFWRKRLAGWDAKLAELDEDFLAWDDRVLKLELSLVMSTFGKANFHSQLSAMQAGSLSTCKNLTASIFCVVTDTLELVTLRASKRRLIFYVAHLTFLAYSWHLQLFHLQIFVSLTAFNSLRGG